MTTWVEVTVTTAAAEPVRLRLVEYETTIEDLPDPDVRRLQAAAGSALSVAPTGQAGQWAITAGSYVGSLVLPEVHVLIRPKIRPENVFLLLEVGLPPSAWGEGAFAYSSSHDLLPAVVSFFARTVDATLARGVLRSYREHRERLIALRGRIDIAEQLRHPGIPSPLACRFDEYTADIAENQFLRAGLRRVLRVPGVDPAARRLVLRNLSRLDEVEDVPIKVDDLDRMVFTRLNRHYEPALRLAALILRNLTLVDQTGKTEACTFLVDMNDVYQRFVAGRLRRLLADRLDVVEEPLEYLGAGRRIPMAPDLVFRMAGRDVYVGDAKYKLTAGTSARASDYYQLLAYTTAMDLDEGVLVYCLSDGEQPDNTVVVRHAGKRLVMYKVDLTGSPDDVEASMAGLADFVWERARPPVLAAVS